MSADVYFSDFRVEYGHSHLDSFIRLIKKAGINKIDFEGKFVAIKVHFGEWGNLAFLRHQYTKVLCDYIKEKGGRPFLTDCNTLYPGYRHDAIGHLEAAYLNGYNPLCTGVHTIIADGLRGTDERLIPVVGGEYVKEAKIGSAIAEADILITLNHVKGHVCAGFGGAIKNIGMGSGSKKGKMEMHSSSTPSIDQDKCVGCGTCTKHCLHNGVQVKNRKAYINEDNCVGCGFCIAFCPKDAIESKFDNSGSLLNMKMAEYAKAVLDGKPAFHISLVRDVSPFCDCEPGNDVPIVPDVGMFASFDPVALDQACADAINSQPINPNSKAGDDLKKCEHEHYKNVLTLIHPDGNYEDGLKHAEKLGVGTRKYNLKTI